jgi:single-stranded DNA-binding protein
MPLAVHEGETTSWHTILFFDDAAQRAIDTLKKGNLVTVIGYKHVRDVQKRDGSSAQVEEIYAAAVQPPK